MHFNDLRQAAIHYARLTQAQYLRGCKPLTPEASISLRFYPSEAHANTEPLDNHLTLVLNNLFEAEVMNTAIATVLAHRVSMAKRELTTLGVETLSEE